MRFERSGEYRELTLAIETAAQIMFANPNSVDDTPATWPRMFSHPTTQPTIGRCFRGQSWADAV